MSDGRPAYPAMRHVCAHCGLVLGWKRCIEAMNGQDSHGMCPLCLTAWLERNNLLAPVSGVTVTADSQGTVRGTEVAHYHTKPGSTPGPATRPLHGRAIDGSSSSISTVAEGADATVSPGGSFLAPSSPPAQSSAAVSTLHVAAIVDGPPTPGFGAAIPAESEVAA